MGSPLVRIRLVVDGETVEDRFVDVTKPDAWAMAERLGAEHGQASAGRSWYLEVSDPDGVLPTVRGSTVEEVLVSWARWEAAYAEHMESIVASMEAHEKGESNE